MRRFLAVLLALLPSLVAAQSATIPSTGGTSSGSSIGGCSAIYAIASVVNGTFACTPGSVVNGTVSTAGRSILTIQDTISGSSTTSNFLNITGTFPATLSAETSGALVSINGDNDSQLQSSLKAAFVSSGGSVTNPGAAIRGDASGSLGNAAAGWFTNSVSTGGTTEYGVIVENAASGSSADSIGVFGGASTATFGNFGVIGSGGMGGSIAARTTGVYGVADSDAATSAVGVWAALSASPMGKTSSAPTTTSKTALLANNGTVAANIFEAQDNGTAVFTIADGGGITATGQYTFGGGSYNLQTNGNTTFNQATAAGFNITASTVGSSNAFKDGANIWIQGDTTLTPDAGVIVTGTNANSIHIFEHADDFDFQNPCTTGLGTSACTDPTLIVHSHNQDTGEFLSMAHDGKAGVIVGGNSTVLDGTIRLGGKVTLTESSATTVLTVPVAVSTGTGGEIIYTVEARDATNTQIRRGTVRYAVANNSSGTETCGVYGVDNAATVNPAETNDGSGAGAITSGTLTYAWTSDTTGTNQCVLKLNGVSSLTQTTFQFHYTVIQSGPGVPTGGD